VTRGQTLACEASLSSADEIFEPTAFAAPLGSKDVRLALAAAEDLCMPMPIASLLRDDFLPCCLTDWGAIGGLAAKDAGLN
jgi:3-hydroxyisobutyrate dehydrogenase-like beta-hydroxyacid dehydrogenase